VSESILDKVAAAHPGAVEQCLTRYGRLLWSLARRWSSKDAEAEDAAQEIFTDLWRAAPRFDLRREPSEATFVAMIARRRLIDRHRKRALQPNTTDLEHALTMPAAGQQDQLEIGEEAGRVRELLEQLRPDERQVLELMFFHGLSQSEISQRIQLPLGTVKTHARRGLIRLRELAADFWERAKEPTT
jgi:RNA polymerase sigma-70 factor (ECF subfamily)